MDELTKKANEVKSRFSISSYYHSQVKDPTPEMLKQINAEIDPETGNVVKKKRVKKEAKTTEKKEKKAKGEESDAMIEMELESDNEEIELESDDDDDDVIRDNKAAIAARKKEAEKKSESGETKTAAETKEVAEAKPKRAPRKRAAKDAEEKPKRAAKDTEEKAKKEVEPKPDEKEIIPVEDSDSDDDHYVPLSERLKRKMDGDKRSSIVDDLINTKSTVPVSRKRKSPAAKSDTAAKKRKAKDESSDDSLFGF